MTLPADTPIFVTGATGYVGRRFLRCASVAGARVVALVRDAGSVPADFRALADVTFVTGDLLAPASYESSIPRDATIVHLAASTGKARRSVHFRTNVDGTKSLLDAARRAGARGFLHVSTVAVKFPDQRHYPYAQSKTKAEDVVKKAGVRFTIVRPTVVLGPNAPVLAGLARMACLPVIPVFGRGSVRLQPVWVDDLVACLAEIVAADRFDGETIDVGGPDVVTAEDLLRRIRAESGKAAARVVHLPLGLARTALAAIEPLLLPVLPLTAGQLCTFANEGTADASAFMSSRSARLRGVDECLRGALDGV